MHKRTRLHYNYFMYPVTLSAILLIQLESVKMETYDSSTLFFHSLLDVLVYATMVYGGLFSVLTVGVDGMLKWLAAN